MNGTDFHLSHTITQTHTQRERKCFLFSFRVFLRYLWYSIQSKRQREWRDFALKIVRLDQDDERVPTAALSDICLLKELKHMNIVRLIYVLHKNLKLTMVFEFCDQISLEIS